MKNRWELYRKSKVSTNASKSNSAKRDVPRCVWRGVGSLAAMEHVLRTGATR